MQSNISSRIILNNSIVGCILNCTEEFVEDGKIPSYDCSEDSSCTSCYYGLLIPLISISIMMFCLNVMIIYNNRFRLIYDCSKFC